jgi:MarR family transcriptional regulator, transcriptional regulator for hemolysin
MKTASGASAIVQFIDIPSVVGGGDTSGDAMEQPASRIVPGRYHKLACRVPGHHHPAMAYDPERSFGFLLHDIARLLRKKFDQRARGLGLSRAQWQLLVHLSRHEGINQSGLAEILEIESITVGRLVDRMEEAGWVERRLDPSDRRARLLYTTEKVAPVMERMRELAEATRNEALAGLSPAARDALIDTLIQVRGNLSERNSRAADEDTKSGYAGN